MSKIIEGKIVNILVQKEDDWGVYIVEREDAARFKCVGVIPAVSNLMQIELEGEQAVTPYGEQFNIKRIIKTCADKNAGLRAVLTTINGIGEKKANVLIEMYGEDAFNALNDFDMLTEVPGIKKATANKIVDYYRENAESLSGLKELYVFFNGAGSEALISTIIKQYGKDASRKLQKNPYIITEIKGIGFKKADALALATGHVKKDSLVRIGAGISYVLQQAEESNGHCFLYREDIFENTAPLLAPIPKISERISSQILENALNKWDKKEEFIKKYKPSEETLAVLEETAETRANIIENLNEALEKAIEEGSLIELDGRIYRAEMYRDETFVTERLLKMKASPAVKKISEKQIKNAVKEVSERKTKELQEHGGSAFVPTEEQLEAVRLGVENRIAVISGGPGRGKTAITEMIAKSFGEDDVIMLAPTGRAADRIYESTGIKGYTIHSQILKAKKNPGLKPIKKLVIVDECSMVDINLCARLLDFASESNLLLIGDADQIASVGPGKVLRDIIESNTIPSILLKQGHRNSGSIARNAELINQGKTTKDYIYDEHFVYVPCEKGVLFKELVRGYISSVKKYGIQNVLLCTAMKQRGPISVTALNNYMQEVFTRGHAEFENSFHDKFRVGDRVMHIKNNYQFVKLVPKENSPSEFERREGVFNGERGTAIKVTKQNGQDCLVVRFDDGTYGAYSKDAAKELTLSYATTIHKCQGSEGACMIMGYCFADYLLMNRSLFYTGETRAKDKFLFYGEVDDSKGYRRSAFDLAARTVNDKKRNTSLKLMLQRYQAESTAPVFIS